MVNPVTIDGAWGDYLVQGNPASGVKPPNKLEQRTVLKRIEGTAAASTIHKATKAALDGVVPAAETYGGVVYADTDPMKNGYYIRSAAAWTKVRGLPDTLARVTLAGAANAQTGTVSTGVDPAVVEMMFAVVAADNTGPMTLSIASETPRAVVNTAGNALTAGEWTGLVLFFLNDDGDYQLINDAGAAASAAQSATDAAAARDAASAFAASAANADAPMVCSQTGFTGGGGVNVYDLSIVSPPAGLSATLVAGMRFVFTPGDTIEGGAAKLDIADFSDGPLYVLTPDAQDYVQYHDLQAEKSVTVEYRTGLSGVAAAGFAIVSEGQAPTQAWYGHGRVKLQTSGAHTISLSQDDGRGLLVWDPDTGAFRMRRLNTITNSALFGASNYVKGVANTALAADTLYAVYAFDTGSAVVLDFWPLEAAPECWDPIVNEIGIYVKNLNGDGTGIDNTRTFLGLLNTGSSDVTTVLGGAQKIVVPCQSHFRPWRFPFNGSHADLASIGTTYTEVPNIGVDFVSTGITDTGFITAHANASNSGAGVNFLMRIHVTGTAFDGSPFDQYSEEAEATVVGAGNKVNLTCAWGTALPMGRYQARVEVKVASGSGGTVRAWMSGIVAN